MYGLVVDRCIAVAVMCRLCPIGMDCPEMKRQIAQKDWTRQGDPWTRDLEGISKAGCRLDRMLYYCLPRAYTPRRCAFHSCRAWATFPQEEGGRKATIGVLFSQCHGSITRLSGASLPLLSTPGKSKHGTYRNESHCVEQGRNPPLPRRANERAAKREREPQ